MEIFATQCKGVYRLAEDKATEGNLCLDEVFTLSTVMHSEYVITMTAFS
jgi:hypothetical protein